jgi:hypothetical protein
MTYGRGMKRFLRKKTRWWNLSSLKRRSCKLSGGPILKGPRTRWFLFLFYQKFWSIIMRDLMALVKKFEKGDINIARLNYAMIILLPKEEEARSLK